MPTSAIVLAAGASRRMGRPKPLLPLLGKPVIRHCLDTLVRAGLQDIVLVFRAGDSAFEEAVSAYTLTRARNAEPESEMADSLRLGYSSVNPAASGILVFLADHPLVRASTVAALIHRHRLSPHTIILPEFKGKRGHPAIFPAAVLGEIRERSTLREVVRAVPHRVAILQVTDPGIIMDMDTPADYARACEHAARRPSLLLSKAFPGTAEP